MFLTLLIGVFAVIGVSTVLVLAAAVVLDRRGPE